MRYISRCYNPYSEPCVNNKGAVSDDLNSVQAIIEQDEVSDDPKIINNEVKDKVEVGTCEGLLTRVLVDCSA